MSALSMADHAQVFHALHMVSLTNPELPAANLHILGHVTLAAELTVEVRFHNQAEAFADWLAAFGITDPATRELELSGDRFVTQAFAPYMGVTFVLTLHHGSRQWQPAAEAVTAS